jgi:pimeloyl-ACP methyl ester carboxylesterase
MDFTEHYFRSQDELSLYYRDYGPGKDTVICLPGLTRNSKDFHEIACHLASRYRVICPDLRGRGQSDRDPEWKNYVPGTYVEDTWNLVDQLGIVRFIIIGTSLGGLMAMIMASQRRQRVEASVLNDIGPEVNPAGYARVLDASGEQVVVKNWQQAAQQCRESKTPMLPGMPAEFWEEYARKTYREGADGTPEFDMDQNVFRVFHEGKLKRIAGSPIDPWDAFRSVTMPCLVLRGGLSDFLSEEIVGRMIRVKPDLHHAVVPNRGHAPLLDEPESVAAIDTFLDQLI